MDVVAAWAHARARHTGTLTVIGTVSPWEWSQSMYAPAYLIVQCFGFDNYYFIKVAAMIFCNILFTIRKTKYEEREMDTVISQHASHHHYRMNGVHKSTLK